MDRPLRTWRAALQALVDAGLDAPQAGERRSASGTCSLPAEQAPGLLARAEELAQPISSMPISLHPLADQHTLQGNGHSTAAASAPAGEPDPGGQANVELAEPVNAQLPPVLALGVAQGIPQPCCSLPDPLYSINSHHQQRRWRCNEAVSSGSRTA